MSVDKENNSTPIMEEQSKIKSAEEILDKYLSNYFNNVPKEHEGEQQAVRGQILKAMEEYKNQSLSVPVLAENKDWVATYEMLRRHLNMNDSILRLVQMAQSQPINTISDAELEDMANADSIISGWREFDNLDTAEVSDMKKVFKRAFKLGQNQSKNPVSISDGYIEKEAEKNLNKKQ